MCAVNDTRHTLRETLSGPLVLRADGRRYHFAGELALGSLMSGEILCGAPGPPSRSRYGALGPDLRWRLQTVAQGVLQA
jgi:hypothetical protein